MPAVVRLGDLSTGHGCFPPTNLVATAATKSYINGILVGLQDQASQFSTHTCGNSTHPQNSRYISSGSTKSFIEGKPVARIGDDIACGDACAQGSPNSFVE
jgi:uncharacterized Zn-binding protein involved in type VI secretion